MAVGSSGHLRRARTVGLLAALASLLLAGCSMPQASPEDSPGSPEEPRRGGEPREDDGPDQDDPDPVAAERQSFLLLEECKRAWRRSMDEVPKDPVPAGGPFQVESVVFEVHGDLATLAFEVRNASNLTASEPEVMVWLLDSAGAPIEHPTLPGTVPLYTRLMPPGASVPFSYGYEVPPDVASYRLVPCADELQAGIVWAEEGVLEVQGESLQDTVYGPSVFGEVANSGGEVVQRGWAIERLVDGQGRLVGSCVMDLLPIAPGGASPFECHVAEEDRSLRREISAIGILHLPEDADGGGYRHDDHVRLEWVEQRVTHEEVEVPGSGGGPDYEETYHHMVGLARNPTGRVLAGTTLRFTFHDAQGLVLFAYSAEHVFDHLAPGDTAYVAFSWSQQPREDWLESGGIPDGTTPTFEAWAQGFAGQQAPQDSFRLDLPDSMPADGLLVGRVTNVGQATVQQASVTGLWKDGNGTVVAVSREQVVLTALAPGESSEVWVRSPWVEGPGWMPEVLVDGWLVQPPEAAGR